MSGPQAHRVHDCGFQREDSRTLPGGEGYAVAGAVFRAHVCPSATVVLLLLICYFSEDRVDCCAGSRHDSFTASNVSSGLRVANSEASVWLILMYKTARNLLEEQPATVDLCSCPNAVHDVSPNSLFTALELRALETWSVRRRLLRFPFHCNGVERSVLFLCHVICAVFFERLWESCPSSVLSHSLARDAMLLMWVRVHIVCISWKRVLVAEWDRGSHVKRVDALSLALSEQVWRPGAHVLFCSVCSRSVQLLFVMSLTILPSLRRTCAVGQASDCGLHVKRAVTRDVWQSPEHNAACYWVGLWSVSSPFSCHS